MAKKNMIYQGKLQSFSNHKIYLNVNHLKKGVYTLKIIHKNKTIKKITFKK